MTIADIKRSCPEMTIFFEGKLGTRDCENDDVIVIGTDDLAFVMRNQGDHDRRFFILDLCKKEKAIEMAKRICKK